MGNHMAERFPSPFDIAAPEGAEGWEELYTYSSLFSEVRRKYEDGAFWFQDGVHWPEALTPWDASVFEVVISSLGQYNTRHYIIPPAYGVDYRILNGYVYLSPVPAPVEDIEARVPLFLERAGFYFGNWDRLYDDSNGIEWTTWFCGARLSIAWNCVHRHARGPLADGEAAVFQGEDGARYAYTYAELSDRVTVLTGRPGRTRETVETPFARPRNYAGLRSEPGYASLFQRLYEGLAP